MRSCAVKTLHTVLYMGKIFYLMGKSASGKDKLFQRLMKDFRRQLSPVILYTTRPIRSGETDGETYHFVNEDMLACYEAQGRLIEKRVYQTVHGPWIYATVDDGTINPFLQSYLMIGTPESYIKTKNYFGPARVCPIYVEVEDGERLLRAIHRERRQEIPRYAELCRRFLADAEDFSEEKLQQAGVTRRFYNDRFEDCVKEIADYISQQL